MIGDRSTGDLTLGGTGTSPLSAPTRLEPKLVAILRRGYTRRQLSRDVVAGVIVGLVALPLAIAFAVASGVKPEQGIYTAIVAGFVVGALGGSRAQISGPTGAFIVIVAGIVREHGYEGLAVATFIAGFLLIAMGFARIGALLRFIPYPVTVGFTSGIALIILTTQVPDLLGLRIALPPAEFAGKWVAYLHHLGSASLAAAGVSALALVVMLVWPRLTRRVPGSLAAIVVATIVVHVFGIPVETIATRFGGVPTGLPSPHLPHMSWELVRQMFSPAITIALLAALESLLSAVVADGMLGTRHRSNMELIAQGAANVVSPIFLGIPATGAIARTATNIKNGGRTPVAAIVHGVTLLSILVFAGRWAALIPMPALAAVLVMVAYAMSEWRAFLRIFKSPKSDVAVLLATFLLTVFIDLTVAIQVGVALAAFLFLRRMAEITEVRQVTDAFDEGEDGRYEEASARAVPAGVEVFEIYGSLFFGAVERFNDAMRRVERPPKVLVLDMRDVHTIDASGIRSLEDLLARTRRKRTALVLSGVDAQPRQALERSGLAQKLGFENIVVDVERALEHARSLLDEAAAPATPRHS